MGDEAAGRARPVRVMQSFGPPRPTSNPYIHMLDAALAHEPGIEHLRFDRRRALFGRYDALHLHWPETLLGGSTRLKATARRAYAQALLVRLRLSRVAVVRTVHNVELPRDVTPWERRMLVAIERRADYRILLNDQTRLGPDIPRAASCVIPHGHFREWFATAPAVGREERTIGFVGLVRRYKGVETLLESFAATRGDRPDWRLVIAGKPSSPALADEIRGIAASDDRVESDLRFLSEDDFAGALRRLCGVVLPYRFMHNSGVALAALSLDRPVLVPENDVNVALAAEVGPGWVHTYRGDLTAGDLDGFMAAIADPPASPPDLSARDWSETGRLHAAAYRAARSMRRGDAPGDEG